jgi:hypothetical protein
MTSSRRCSTSAPPEITFFTDRDLGLQFPAILREAGLRVERHADHFAPNCPDEEWLEAVAQRGWTAVTHDARIRYKPNELAAVEAHKVALLVVVGHAPYAELARSFVATADRIVRFVGEHDPPLIAKVYRPTRSEVEKDAGAPGRIEMWYPLVGVPRSARTARRQTER